MLKNNTIVNSKNLRSTIKASGIIVKMYSGHEYTSIISTIYNTDMTPWDNDFPEWKTKPVYAVMFDMPFKSCTLEQWINHAVQKGIKADVAISTYGSECPCTQIMCFPADDLEEIKSNELEEKNNMLVPASVIPGFYVKNNVEFKKIKTKTKVKIIPTLIKAKHK